MRRALPRAAGTAALAGTRLLRVLRVLENLESVRRFYPGTYGPLWTLIELALFFGPYLTAVSAIAALWLRRNAAGQLGTVNFCAAAFFTCEEGLTCFARYINANSAYVGAEPLFSALVCGVSAATVLGSLREGWQKPQREGDYHVD